MPRQYSVQPPALTLLFRFDIAPAVNSVGNHVAAADDHHRLTRLLIQAAACNRAPLISPPLLAASTVA